MSDVWEDDPLRDEIPPAGKPGEGMRSDKESFTRGRNFELDLWNRHLTEHVPAIPGICYWCKGEEPRMSPAHSAAMSELQEPTPCGHRKTNLRPGAAGKLVCEVCEATVAAHTEAINLLRFYADGYFFPPHMDEKVGKELMEAADYLRGELALAPSLAQPDREGK